MASSTIKEANSVLPPNSANKRSLSERIIDEVENLSPVGAFKRAILRRPEAINIELENGKFLKIGKKDFPGLYSLIERGAANNYDLKFRKIYSPDNTEKYEVILRNHAESKTVIASSSFDPKQLLKDSPAAINLERDIAIALTQQLGSRIEKKVVEGLDKILDTKALLRDAASGAAIGGSVAGVPGLMVGPSVGMEIGLIKRGVSELKHSEFRIGHGVEEVTFCDRMYPTLVTQLRALKKDKYQFQTETKQVSPGEFATVVTLLSPGQKSVPTPVLHFSYPNSEVESLKLALELKSIRERSF